MWRKIMAYNVGSYTQDGILPDKLSTKSCLLKFKFPVNEPPKPGLRVADVMHSNSFFQYNIFMFLYAFYNRIKFNFYFG